MSTALSDVIPHLSIPLSCLVGKVAFFVLEFGIGMLINQSNCSILVALSPVATATCYIINIFPWRKAMSSPRQRLSKRKSNPLPAATSNEDQTNVLKQSEQKKRPNNACSSKTCSKEEIWELLRYNRETLEEYIAVEVPQETIERWVILKAKMKPNQGKDKLNTALLKILKLILNVTTSTDVILQAISDEAVTVFNADRSSIFFVDEPKRELYARIFGVPPEETQYIEKVKESSIEMSEGKDQPLAFTHVTESLSYRGQAIRFPVSDGIAGHVAQTGEVVLCTNAGNDSRFNSQVDLITGYRTHTILCAPLKTKERIFGVLEIINKDDGCTFTQEDKQLFTEYAEICSQIYATTKSYLNAKCSEQQSIVTMEMLAYHRQCTESEIQELRQAEPLDKHWQDQLLLPTFNTLQLNETQQLQAAFLMFSNLAHTSNLSDLFNSDTVLRFLLTVAKNYRPVPYHNWLHAFWVAQAMYVAINSHLPLFPEIERIALFTACICHDLDHRGYSNSFLVKSNAPLSALYSTSVMENHHFNQTLAILQTPGLNIFSQLDPTSFKIVLQCMENAIIATDLALFAEKKANIESLIAEGTFSWKNNKHRLLGQALLMTGCDVSASARPWPMHKTTVDWLTEEFYKQGDEEKAKGIKPFQLMDKDYNHMLPSFQIGFMKGISLPSYTLLSNILPYANVLAEETRNNIKKWHELEEKNNA